MRPDKFILSLLLTIVINAHVVAQADTVPVADTTFIQVPAAGPADLKMNIIKLNLISPVFMNFSLQYERIINNFLSATLTGRYRPKSTVPYVNSFYNNLFGSTDPAIEEAFKRMKLSSYGMAVELRFYVGKKGYGKGFYIAPTYRYSKITMNDLLFVYAASPDNESLTFSGYSNANYGGLMFGAQWFLGKHLTLDWWFFGPLAGWHKSSVDAVSTIPLTPENQAILKEKLEDWEMPLTQTNVQVNAYGASLDLSGWMFGYNFGLALGVRF